MPAFSCTFDMSQLPQSVHRGEMIRAAVTAIQYNQPIHSAVIAADSYGVSQRLKKLDDRTFLLELRVPFFAPSGQFRYSIWAVSEKGESSARQGGVVTIR